MKTALLLLNMGGPNNLSEVEIFLKNMFNDKAIIPAPSPIRALVAYVIVKKRLSEATHNYRLLGGVSPIVKYTKELVDSLNTELKHDVFHIMRYTPPFAYDVLSNIRDYDKFIVVPLYPHFSSTTTKSSLDDLFKAAKRLDIKQDRFLFIDKFYDNILYNQAIVQRIKEAIGDDDPEDFELIFSAHGLPKKLIQKGDPYVLHVKRNIFYARKELIKEGIRFFKTHLAYQSRLGPMEWVRPYLEDKLKSLEKRRVVVYPISFLIDNSETEFELDMEYREIAEEIGFIDYRVAKAPNLIIKETIKDLVRLCV